jgi:hypothetical protein
MLLKYYDRNGVPVVIVCEACGGCGIQHCCDGLHEQPDEECLEIARHDRLGHH